MIRVYFIFILATHTFMITSLLHQNHASMSFWRLDDIINASCVQWTCPCKYYVLLMFMLRVKFICCWPPDLLRTYLFDDCNMILGFYSLNGKTSYRQISWNLESARLDATLIISLWNLTTISAVLLPRCLSNLRAIGQVNTRISRLQDFTRSYGKTSVRRVNISPSYVT